jgi:hypothetical protein
MVAKTQRCLLLFLLLSPLILLAQNVSPQSVAPLAYNGARESIDGAHIKPIPGASFSARVELQTTQTLADGSTVAYHTFNARFPREDAQRKSPVEQSHHRCGRQLELYRFVRSGYPNAGVSLSRRSLRPPIRLRCTTAGSVARSSGEQSLSAYSAKGRFGRKVQLSGLRETKTYPPGSIGNEKPIAITDEYWYSPGLQVNVSVTRTDPRFGVQTVELTDLKRGEPDAALSEIPAEYKVVNESGAASGVPQRPQAMPRAVARRL